MALSMLFIRHQVLEGVRDGVLDTVLDGVLDTVLDGVRDTVLDGVRDGVLDTVADGVRDGVLDAVCDGVEDAVRDGVFDGECAASTYAFKLIASSMYVQSSVVSVWSANATVRACRSLSETAIWILLVARERKRASESRLAESAYVLSSVDG